MTFTCPALTAN